jgi:hypothetical protein
VVSVIRHFSDNVQSLWILQKISNIAEAAEFLSGQEIPGQNPGFRDNASGDKGRTTTQRHHTDQGQKRPRPNDSRFNVTGPPFRLAVTVKSGLPKTQDTRRRRTDFSRINSNDVRETISGVTTTTRTGGRRAMLHEAPRIRETGAEYRTGPKVLPTT